MLNARAKSGQIAGVAFGVAAGLYIGSALGEDYRFVAILVGSLLTLLGVLCKAASGWSGRSGG